LLTDQQFHNVGVGMDAPSPTSRDSPYPSRKDTGAFKTPTLLDISKSAPYFHDGSAKTLEEAVDFMVDGGRKNPYLDTTNLKPVTLTAQEKADLMAFLRSLDVKYTIPDPKLP
jgi:cytochrome c peroxidase